MFSNDLKKGLLKLGRRCCTRKLCPISIRCQILVKWREEVVKTLIKPSKSNKCIHPKTFKLRPLNFVILWQKTKVQSLETVTCSFSSITGGPNSAWKDHCLQQNTIFTLMARADHCLFLTEVTSWCLGQSKLREKWFQLYLGLVRLTVLRIKINGKVVQGAPIYPFLRENLFNVRESTLTPMTS